MSSYAAITGPPSEHGSRPASTSSQSRRSRYRKETGYAGQASWLSSVINLVNTIVGAGVLAMPSALSNMGILLGVLVILWSGLTAGFGLYLQTRCARYLDRGSASFFALSQMTYPNAAVVFDAAIAIKCFGVGISYLIIIGDLMPGVVRGFGDTPPAHFLVDRHFWVTAFMYAALSLSLHIPPIDDIHQAHRHPLVVSAQIGFSQIHQCHCLDLDRILGHPGGLSFRQGGHAG